MLVVDRLETMDLERDDDEIFAASPGFEAHLRGLVGKAFAIEQPRGGIGRCKKNRTMFLFNARLRFMLKINITPPAEQDERDV